MIFFPTAKINIGLNILEKRNDGFHNLNTIFYPINLSDVVEFTENNKNQYLFFNTGIKINLKSIEDNLLIKAYNILKKDFELPYIDVHLHKIIPIGAGLGGGSSDAAFMLKSINSYFKLNISNNELANYAQELGSDCNFFISNKPVFACEKGNILQDINFDLKGYYIAVIYPGININTAKAYSLITPVKPKQSLYDLIKLPINEWKNFIYNDFEKIIFPMYPVIEDIKIKLYNSGAIYSSMSGSGSAVFGIFEKQIEIKNYFENFFVW